MNELTAIVRAYNFMYKKFIDQADFPFDPEYVFDPISRYEAGQLEVFVYGSVVHASGMEGNRLTPLEVMIKYFLVQFNNWTKWQPRHQIKFYWMYGDNAYKRWTWHRYKKVNNDRIVFHGLLDSWNTSIKEIKEYALQNEDVEAL